jgi:AraC family transcriptional regulator
MTDVAHAAVQRVVQYIYNNLAEEITIDDMARMAIFSKFHFSRIFLSVTGISPGRFLSAIRLQSAKRLLISTALPVTEICYRSGYTSVGTFSSRFAAVVGLSPTEYRNSGGFISKLPLNARRNDWGPGGTINVQVFTPASARCELIFIGVFPDPIIQGRPIRYAVVNSAGLYVLDGIPRGTWYVMAHSFNRDGNPAAYVPTNDEPPPLFAAYGPAMVGPGRRNSHVDLRMQPMRMTDPPMLLAVPDVEPGCGQAVGAVG